MLKRRSTWWSAGAGFWATCEPINELVLEGSQIVAKSLTEAQLESGTSFDETDPAYKPMPVSQTVDIAERR